MEVEEEGVEVDVGRIEVDVLVRVRILARSARCSSRICLSLRVRDDGLSEVDFA